MKSLINIFKRNHFYRTVILKHRNYLIFYGLLLLGFASTLYVEYKFQYEQFKWLEWRVLIIALAIVQYGRLPKIFRKRNVRRLYLSLGLTLLLYGLNFLANLINVYHLDKFQSVTDFCIQNGRWCASISENFFKFKMYRFVSLTSYFFMYVIFLIIGLLFSEPIYERVLKIVSRIPQIHVRRVKFKKIKFKKVKLKYVLLFYFFVVYILSQQLISAFSTMSKNIVKMYYTLAIPYDQRWEAVMGGRFSFGWMKTYADFVNEQTPPNTVILIPNREAPWEMEGNPYYLRWFIYPRDMVQMFESTEIPANADYALLTYGVFGYNKKTFPDFSISRDKIEKIIIVNQNNLTVTVKEKNDYNPADYTNVWGLIQFKK